MKEVCKLSNIEKYEIGNTCIVKKENKLYSLNDSFVLTEIEYQNVYDFAVYKEYVYFQNDNLLPIYRYNTNNKLTDELSGHYVMGIVWGANLFYVIGRDNRNIKSVFSINKENLHIVKTIPYVKGLIICEIDDNELLYDEGTCIYCHNLSDNINVWQFDIVDSEVRGNIIKYNNILIVPLKNDHLLGINAQTGEKLWELEDCFNYYNLEEETERLYGYGAEHYEIINITEGKKILQKKFDGSLDKYKIFVSQHMSTLYKDGLYFTSNEQQIKFGKVNIRTHEIEFVQDLIEDKERIGWASASKPVYHNGRLYILDSVGTLHVFE